MYSINVCQFDYVPRDLLSESVFMVKQWLICVRFWGETLKSLVKVEFPIVVVKNWYRITVPDERLFILRYIN